MDDCSKDIRMTNSMMDLPILIGNKIVFSTDVDLPLANRNKYLSLVVPDICINFSNFGTQFDDIKTHPRSGNLESWLNIA